MALSYRQVKDLYDTLRDSGATSVSLPEWSGQMNELSGTDLYGAGLHDNFIKRGSVGIDRLLEATGLPQRTEAFGRDFGALFGNPEAGAAVGRGLPRGVVNFLPLLIPGGGLAAGAARLGLSGALAGADTYAATDSPAHGVVSALTNAFMPGVANKAEQFALSKLGGRLVEGPLQTEAGMSAVSRLFPKTLGQGIASQAAGQLGASAFGELGSALGSGVDPNEDYHFSPSEAALNMTLGQLPFAGLYATKHGRESLGGKTTREAANALEDAVRLTRQNIELRAAKEAAAQKSGIESVPEPATKVPLTPEVGAEIQSTLARLRGEQAAVAADPNLSPEEKVARLAPLVQQDAEVSERAGEAKRGNIMGQPVGGLYGHELVTGRELPHRKGDKVRRILTESGDESGNPPELQGKVIDYSKGKYEPQPQETGVPGVLSFGIPKDPNWRTVFDPTEQRSDYTPPQAARPAGENSNPELPVQENAPTDPFSPEHFGFLTQSEAAVQQAKNEIDAAGTPAALQAALLRLHRVQEEYGLPLTDDVRLKKRMEQLARVGVKADRAAKLAATAEARATERQLAALRAHEQRVEDIRLGDQFRAEQETLAETDDATREELDQLHGLESTLGASRSSYADALLGGELNRMYQEWATDGRKGGFDRFAQGVMDVLKSGKGLLKTVVPAKVESTVAKLDDSPEMSPLDQFVLEQTASILNTDAARAAFQAWPRNKETNFTHEQAMFVALVDAHALHSKGKEAAANVFKEMEGMDDVEARDEAEDFLQRPHVKEWLKGLEEKLSEGSRLLPSKTPAMEQAGGGFVWGLTGYDSEGNRLGKHVLPKSGVLRVSQFKNMAGRGKPLPDAEVETLRAVVPEAFDAEGNVNVRELYKGLKEKGPVVETHVYGQEGKQSEAKMELDKMTHEWYDNLKAGAKNVVAYYKSYTKRAETGLKSVDEQNAYIKKEYADELTKDYGLKMEDVDRYIDLQDKVKSEPPDTSPRATSYYNQISPFDTKKYPVIRIDVVVPKQYGEPPPGIDNLEQAKQYYNRGMISDAEYRRYKETGKWEKTLWSPDNLHENLPNTLGWIMAQVVPGPDGKPTLFVGESQSRWQQAKQKEDTQIRSNARNTGISEDRIRAHMDDSITTPSHPLLPIQHTLLLKAAIAEAQRRGIDSVTLSDGETAMMTEGHDKATNSNYGNAREGQYVILDQEGNMLNPQKFDDKEKADKWRERYGDQAIVKQLTAEDVRPEISQEGGMRLHYDTTLPSAMRKLTGEAGEKVDMGVHKNATSRDRYAFAGDPVEQATVEGSPVFRNPDGTPKSSVTGTRYPLDKAFANLDAQSGFTVADPSRAPWRPSNPEEQKVVQNVQPERGGIGLLAMLNRSSDPRYRALATDLMKFGESLRRIKVELTDMPGEGDARGTAARSALLRFKPELFMGDPARAEQVVAHELLHGLTLAELNSPTNQKHFDDLTALRERLAQALPPKLKALYDKAQSSNWLQRYDGGTAMMKEIGKDWAEQSVVYGLLNNKELVSQGFSSDHMIQFMKGVKADGGQTFYHRFVNWVGSLLGKIVGKNGKSAYGEFLSKTDALLQRGEWVSDFNNYSERYLEGLGVAPEVAKAQTQRALQLVMDSNTGTSRDLLLASLDVNPAVRSPEYRRAERDLNRVVGERGDDFQNMTQALAEHGLTSDQRGMDELVQDVMAGRVDPEVFDVLPEAASKYAFERVRDHQQVLDVIRAATLEKNQGLVNIAQPQQMRQPVKEALRATERVLGASRAHDDAVAQIQALFAASPGGLFDKVVGDPSNAPRFLADAVEDTKDSVKGFGSWIKNFLQPIGQRARENPETAEAYSKGWQLQSNARKFASEGLKAFGYDLNDPRGLSHESVKRSTDALKNPRSEKAADDWIYLNQKEGKANASAQMLPASHPEVQKILSRLTPKERDDVIDLVSKQVASTQVTNAQALEKMQDIASVRAAGIMNADNGLKTSQNIQVADEMFRSILDLNDPAKAALAQQRLQLAASRFANPQTFSDVLRFMESEVGKYRLWKEFYDKNPAYATGQRLGKFLVEFKRNGRSYLLQAETKSAARDLAEGGTNVEIRPNVKTDDAFPELGPDAVGLLTRIKELEENQYQLLGSRMTPEQIESLRATSPAAQLATEASYRGGIPNPVAPPRRLTKGAEELPWLSNHFSWVHRQANYWSRQLFRAQMDAHTMEKEIVDRPDLQKELRTHAENMLHPDSPAVQKINRLASTWFMGFNVATALVNSAQPFVTHVAELTSMTGKPLDSYRRVLNALGEIAGEKVGKDWATPEHKWLMDKAAHDGEIDLAMFDNEAAAQESVATNYKRAIQSNKPQTLGQRLSTVAGNYSTAAFWLFKQGERINNQSALLASFDYYREQGMSKEDAYAKATEFNHGVNYGGGRAQRPVGAFSGQGAFPRSAAMLATSLQSYVLGTTFQLARYLQKGLFRPAGLTPAETFSARKAAVQMLGTQLAAAGVLGMPFVSGAIALLDKAFPALELNKNLREMMSSLFGEDEKNGNVLTDMAMTGVPSMLGWDLQSRLSMGNTVPGVSEVNGFQPELLAGPSVNLISNFVNGGRRVAQGDMSGAAQLLPKPIRNLLDVVRGGPVTDYKDRPLFDPTPGEVLGKAIGFQPKRLSDSNAAQRILRQAEDNSSRRASQDNQAMAAQVLQGNFGTVRQQLLAKAQSDKNYNPVDSARAVARAAEELSFPRDLRREGTGGTANSRNQLLSSFGVTPSAGSEMQRLQFRMMLEQKLGVPPRDQSSQVQEAQMMDQLAAKQPGLSRLELRRLVQKLTRSGSVPPTLREPQGSL